MSREKQIEEMAKAMCGNGMSNGNCATDDYPCKLECVYGCCAERLYSKGYRKQNEVIDTFVTRAKDSMELMPTVYKSFYGKMLDRIACEMKGGAE